MGKNLYQKFSAVFDTEDFSKDNAKYELNWIQKSNDKRMEGKTFRNQMTNTPSTIHQVLSDDNKIEGNVSQFIMHYLFWHATLE